MTRSLVSVCAVVLCCVTAAAQLSYDRTVELRQCVYPSLLPQYREGIVEQISTYDPAGSNDDGFSGQHSYLRREGGGYVIADIKGPAVINRFWTATQAPGDTLVFYFDGENEPRIRLGYEDLFTGFVEPFVAPLCREAAGGSVCYLPIPFRESCKIVFYGQRLRFHQIQYRLLKDLDVRTFEPELSSGERALVDSLAQLWETPGPAGRAAAATRSDRVRERSFTLRPGRHKTIFRTRRGGRISAIEIDAGDGLEGLYKDILIRARWDGDSLWAINAPAADFFGYAFGRSDMGSALLGRDGTINYCYLPAPFDRRAVLSLDYKRRDGVSQKSVNIKVRVRYSRVKRNPSAEGRLYSCWRRVRPADGEYHSFLRHKGRGHYVGTILQAQGLTAEDTRFFEGDDSTFVDGSPRIHGTGSEDYFGGGWYGSPGRWDRPINTPLYGCLGYSQPMSRTGGYRFMVADKMSFREEIFCGIEHGPEGCRYPVDYTSVAFYYGDSPAETQSDPEVVSLREVFVPRKHKFIASKMHFVASPSITLQEMGGGGFLCTCEGSGSVGFTIGGLPPGPCRIFAEVQPVEDGMEISLQKDGLQLGDWKSSRGTYSRTAMLLPMGEADLSDGETSFSLCLQNGKRLFIKGFYVER